MAAEENKILIPGAIGITYLIQGNSALDCRSVVTTYATLTDSTAWGSTINNKPVNTLPYVGLTTYVKDRQQLYVCTKTGSGSNENIIANSEWQPVGQDLSGYATKDDLTKAVTGLFKFKGSDTGAAIIAKATKQPQPQPGDVWNVTDSITLTVNGTATVYPVGTNVVWVDTTYKLDAEGKPTDVVDVPAHWDAFGGLCDLSGYLTKPDYSDSDVNKVLTVVKETDGTVTHQWKTLPDSAIYWEDIV
jgi:hypothetical protein